MNNTRVFSINEITQIIGNLINRIPLNNFLCKGEIVSFKIARKYIYIDLCDIDTSSATDSRAQIKVMYFLSSELEKERLENSILRREKLLNNENYVNKAPKEIVETERKMLEKERQELDIIIQKLK